MGVKLEKLGGTDWGEEGLRPTSDLVPTLNEMLDFAALGHAQHAYQALEAAGSFTNRDFLATDRFISMDGVNKTSTIINNNEAPGDTLHAVGSWASSGNAFNTNLANAANNGDANNDAIGKTFAAKTVTVIAVKADFVEGGGETATIKLQTYNGSTWDTRKTWPDSLSNLISVEEEYFLNISVQGVRLLFETNSGSSRAANVFTLSYTTDTNQSFYLETSNKYEAYGGSGAYANSSFKVETGLVLTGSETSAIVYALKEQPANTSVTVGFTDGTTTISSKALNEVHNISSLGSGTLKVIFNLNTTNVNDTPKISGYGVYLK